MSENLSRIEGEQYLIWEFLITPTAIIRPQLHPERNNLAFNDWKSFSNWRWAIFDLRIFDNTFDNTNGHYQTSTTPRTQQLGLQCLKIYLQSNHYQTSTMSLMQQPGLAGHFRVHPFHCHHPIIPTALMNLPCPTNIIIHIQRSCCPQALAGQISKNYALTKRMTAKSLIMPGSYLWQQLAKLQVQGCKNQGTINFLELLQSLQPFFWWVS